MKKSWEKPELVVLVRGKPEESVLQVCKGPRQQGYGQGPDSWLYDDCWHETNNAYCVNAIPT